MLSSVDAFDLTNEGGRKWTNQAGSVCLLYYYSNCHPETFILHASGHLSLAINKPIKNGLLRG